MRWRVVQVSALLLAVLVASCARSDARYSPVYSPDLAVSLPGGDEIPVELLGFDDGAKIVADVYTRSVGARDQPIAGDTSFDGPQVSLANRPGDVGVRDYLINPSIDHSADAEVILRLYGFDRTRDAFEYWKQFPPEFAYRYSANNLDPRSDLEIERELGTWRFTVKDPASRREWQGVCLSGPDRAGRCIDFYGWVQLCTHVLEVNIGIDSRLGVATESAASTMRALADQVAEAVGCV